MQNRWMFFWHKKIILVMFLLFVTVWLTSMNQIVNPNSITVAKIPEFKSKKYIYPSTSISGQPDFWKKLPHVRYDWPITSDGNQNFCSGKMNPEQALDLRRLWNFPRPGSFVGCHQEQCHSLSDRDIVDYIDLSKHYSDDLLPLIADIRHIQNLPEVVTEIKSNDLLKGPLCLSGQIGIPSIWMKLAKLNPSNSMPCHLFQAASNTYYSKSNGSLRILKCPLAEMTTSSAWPMLRTIIRNSDYIRCRIHEDIRLVPESDGVHMDGLTLAPLPENRRGVISWREILNPVNYRSSRQLWMISTGQISPKDYPFIEDDQFLGQFNLTHGHDRRISQFHRNGNLWFLERMMRLFIQNSPKLQDKSKLAIYLENDCYSDRGPVKFINEMRKYIPIDSLPECGNGSLNLEKQIETIRSYKFVFVIERSGCFDLVGEKIYKAVLGESVPVYLGAPNTRDFFPDWFAIYVSHFSQLKDLASFLSNVGQDPDLYSKFFSWRNSPTADSFFSDQIRSSSFDPNCELCFFLHHIGACGTGGSRCLHDLY